MKSTAFWVIAVSSIFLFSSPQVYAIPVDLNNFNILGPTVSIAADGSSAIISEDSQFAPVGIKNEDFFIPADAQSLSFDYRLVVAPYNEDYFDFYFGDLSAPLVWFGGYNDGPEDLIYSGTIDTALYSYEENSQPIAFALSYGWLDVGYETVLTISNVQINPVPEPATLLLTACGLLGIMRFRKRKISGATR